uniref:RHS repeat-associated core domain-containing protein n=1 Tax=uncultured Fibrobacter sp. TaxID=261512 RepID=UPI0026116A4F|nr:RHS repeat-associated core domain-containing protein [uncultured Fibrobacter sp.]
MTTSERDDMGRLSKKCLPFAMECKNVEDCNSNLKTLYNPGMAIGYYTASNPDYPDAGGVPYVETKWKPDPMATKDVEGAPGSDFGVTGVDGRTHLVKSYSSGVNLSGVNLLDSASLNSAVAAVRHGRAYDGDTNYRAARDATPTHLWELNTDQDGRRAFTVKDGAGHIIVSGSLGSTGNLLTRSVNELDARGNVVKSHPPVSCSYTPKPASCVTPSEFGYDAQSQMVWSLEPDAGETRTFYDLMGRVRATQTQRQIDSGAYSITVYDNHDRPIYTGEWKTALDSGDARAYFDNVQNRFNPTVAELTPGTVTRMFYDRIPTRDTLDVELYPANVSADAFKYGKTRTVAVISDVSADSAGNVVRISTANAYDKYGRITATYTYAPTVPTDSLKMLAVETEYDLGGKVTRIVRYPYGVGDGGKVRKIAERYTYDRLGRIDSVFSKNGSASEVLLATYAYYPTGSVKTVTMGNSITLTYTYHISGAVKSSTYTTFPKVIPATSPSVILSDSEGSLYSETLYYEDCGSNTCTPQYNGNISRMVHELAHGNTDFTQYRDVAYTYDQLNRLTNANDIEQGYFDEVFKYDAQGRMTVQRRDTSIAKNVGGEYSYYANTNRLKSIANGMGGTADDRDMSDAGNFVYDSEGNLIEDKSKKMKIFYDWRGMPVEFVREIENGDSLKLVMKYDGNGKRISKENMRKVNSGNWTIATITHYTGIGTEIRENFAGPTKETKVVVNMPQGLGRYGIEDAERPDFDGMTGNSQVGYIPNVKFEWYLKNHLGSTMLVYGTVSSTDTNTADIGETKAAYDYRAFGEMVTLSQPSDKVTENFTGKEHDDEISLDYFGARYLDPMLGMWISVDPARQFASPYLYAGNGMNPVNVVDPDGNETTIDLDENNKVTNMTYTANDNTTVSFNKPGVEPFTAAEPPLQSYFFDKNEDGTFKNVGAIFDNNMDNNAQSLLKAANELYPFGDIKKWGTGGDLDFKNKFYNENVRTIGILNGTAMTPRDAGNAIWGGWTREKYYTPYFIQRGLSNGYQFIKKGKLEDTQSSVMQIWGFGNYKPK